MRGGLVEIAVVGLMASLACEQPGTSGVETDLFPGTLDTTSGSSLGTADTSETSQPTSASPTSDPTTSTEPTVGPESSGETGSPLCGNMAEDPGEDCDDGNDVQADGCNNDCTISGALVWEHVHASGNGTDWAYGVAIDREGDAYVGGLERTASDTAVAWIRKYTRQGGLEWTRTIDGNASGDDQIVGVGGSASDIVVMGTLANGGNTGDDIVFARYDASGNQAWQVPISSAIVDGKGFPTPGQDGGYAAAFAPDGTPVVAGFVQTQGASRNAWVRKLTSAGDESWTATFDGAASSNDQAHAVAVDATGAVIAAGFEQGATSRDVWARKYDAAGAEIWTHRFDGTEMLEDSAEGVAVDDDGNVILSGYEGTAAFASAVRWWVRKLDPDGNEMWTVTDDGETVEGAQAYGAAATSSGDIAVVGRELAAGVYRAIVRKYDGDGNERWVEKYDAFTGTSAHLFGVADREDEGLYVVGQIDRGVDGADAWIMRLSP